MAQAFTRRLAQYIWGRNSDDSLPEPAAERSKDIMINAAAVALAGSAQPEALAVARFVRDMGGDGKCTVIGMGLRTSPVQACLANGLMVRLVEFDDDIVGYGGHPTAVVFPVVMALAELERCSGSKVLNAFIHGCEIVSKLGALAAPGDPDQPGATNPDRLSGPLGAAAAAGMIMGLDLPEIATALELASAGNIHPATGMTGRASMTGPIPPLHYGQMAEAGITAALLAKAGMTTPFTGPGSSGRAGWPPPGLSAVQQEEFFATLGNPFDVVTPGPALRLYPCPPAAHGPIDAVLHLLEQHRLEPDYVESITVRVTPSALKALPVENPQTPWEARQSLPFLVAVTWMHGQPLLEQFSEESLADPSVRRLMRRVSTVGDEASTALAPQPATVTVTTTQGRTVQQRVEFARGGPELPLDPEVLDAKFLYCARHVMTPDHILGAIEQFRSMEEVKDLSGLASILGA